MGSGLAQAEAKHRRFLTRSVNASGWVWHASVCWGGRQPLAHFPAHNERNVRAKGQHHRNLCACGQWLIVCNSLSPPKRTPHGRALSVQGRRWNRIDRPSFFIERPVAGTSSTLKGVWSRTPQWSYLSRRLGTGSSRPWARATRPTPAASTRGCVACCCTWLLLLWCSLPTPVACTRGCVSVSSPLYSLGARGIPCLCSLARVPSPCVLIVLPTYFSVRNGAGPHDVPRARHGYPPPRQRGQGDPGVRSAPAPLTPTPPSPGHRAPRRVPPGACAGLCAFSPVRACSRAQSAFPFLELARKSSEFDVRPVPVRVLNPSLLCVRVRMAVARAFCAGCSAFCAGCSLGSITLTATAQGLKPATITVTFA